MKKCKESWSRTFPNLEILIKVFILPGHNWLKVFFCFVLFFLLVVLCRLEDTLSQTSSLSLCMLIIWTLIAICPGMFLHASVALLLSTWGQASWSHSADNYSSVLLAITLNKRCLRQMLPTCTIAVFVGRLRA